MIESPIVTTEKLLAVSHTLYCLQLTWRMDLVLRMDPLLTIDSPLTSERFSSQLVGR